MRVIQMISALAALIFVRVVLVPCRSGMLRQGTKRNAEETTDTVAGTG